MNRCVVLDAGALSALAGRPERRNREVRAALRAAARLDREVVVPAVILAELYRGARGLLFPSIYEGFGLPILEAMSCGCPVITSNTSACAEVAGGAALEVDPTSVPDLVAAMRR